MQTVPSLVGTGTAVAAAATGLVFGQPSPTSTATTTTTTTTSTTAAATTSAIAVATASVVELSHARTPHKKTASADVDVETHSQPQSLVPRPSTRTAAPSIGPEPAHQAAASPLPAVSRPPVSRRQRPRSLQVNSPKSSTGTLSFAARHTEPSLLAAVAGSRESASSNGSWIRRLSMRPLSQQSSCRSSFIAENSSLSCPLAEAATIFHRPGPAAPPLAPNKLVKRSPSLHNNASPGEASPGLRSKGYLPGLRRPATSHQRSATLQQFRADIDVAGSAAHPKYSFEQPIWPEELLGASPFDPPPPVQPTAGPGWASFFHAQTIAIAASCSVEGGVGHASPGARRPLLHSIWPQRGSRRHLRAHLIKPGMVSAPLAPVEAEAEAAAAAAETGEVLDRLDGLAASPQRGPPTRTRRSLSESLSSATNWVSKRLASLRWSRRGADAPKASSDSRHVSDPARGSPSPTAADQHEIAAPAALGPSMMPPLPMMQQRSMLDAAAAAQEQPPTHHQTPAPPCSLPLPSLASLSLAVGAAGDASPPNASSKAGLAPRQARPHHPSVSSTSSTVLSQFARASYLERGAAVDAEGLEARDLASGDDDDLDLKSDTVYDSLRTLSSRARAVETPLESFYDDSPPSTAGNRRSSMLDTMTRGWDDVEITEEDEDESTTPCHPDRRCGVKFAAPGLRALAASPRSGSESSDGMVGRLRKDPEGSSSENPDADEDWTREDGVPLNSALSALCKSSSSLARGVNPNVRLALASIEGRPGPRAGVHGHRADRPLSSLFDWSEPPKAGKQDGGGDYQRPKTAYAMPDTDSRGGRSVVRKGPMLMHVRSQSVSVAHELVDDAKAANSKYGTWGMGTKTVSEDWDEDFEFSVGGGEDSPHAIAVPESIRATQPSVRVHSGQLRELSLLVNDLKRLCRHGRELGMLNGEHKGLWREVEGIIALASPDEDNVEEKSYPSGPGLDLGALDLLGLPPESRYDGTCADVRDESVSVDGPETANWKTAVVRERPSPRRRSVFSPEDDIFGGTRPLAEDNSAQPGRLPGQPRTPHERGSAPNDGGVVRSVMESMRQHARPPGEATTRDAHGHGRVQFDTNSLKALVRRAGELRDLLSDMIREAEQITQSPAATPRHERRLDSSPAFTRVFGDPGSSPQRSPLGHGGSPVMEGTQSPDRSPSSPLGSPVPVMTVS